MPSTHHRSRNATDAATCRGFLSRLAKDTGGNTLALVGAATFPVLAIIGGGVDVGRGYMAQTRLQQACDAGVLAARKRLGSDVIVTGVVPGNVATAGKRFFDTNFKDRIYGTSGRAFRMTLEEDMSVSGEAEVTVPTTVMGVFGEEAIDISVTCQAKLSFQNVDVMMALDVTGSMRHTNVGDELSRIDSLRQVIKNFHAQVEGSKGPDTRTRYGFVPYSTNVNVGSLLVDDWVHTDWTYQSRELDGSSSDVLNNTVWEGWTYISGELTPWTTVSTYAATYYPATNEGTPAQYKCEGTQPANSVIVDDVFEEPFTEPYAGPPEGEQTIQNGQRTENGTAHQTVRNGSTCEVQARTYTNYVNDFRKRTFPVETSQQKWIYRAIDHDGRDWRTETSGCIEERATYEIDDYESVDLSRAMDLDINLVPNRGDPDTQWKPRYPNLIYARSLENGGGSFTPDEVTSEKTFSQTGNWWQSACPAAARRLAAMTSEDLDSYLATLSPFGATYHDIGMIWAGRLLSQKGIFRTANRNVSVGKPTSRHLIFLTDGQTEPYDVAYGPYGLEPLDQRRWNADSSLSLKETVEQRFLVACNEVKKNNTTVWVIAFGTTVNPVMSECAGEGRWFKADDAAQLNEAFSTIAGSLGDLRISS